MLSKTDCLSVDEDQLTGGFKYGRLGGGVGGGTLSATSESSTGSGGGGWNKSTIIISLYEKGELWMSRFYSK